MISPTQTGRVTPDDISIIISKLKKK